MAGQTAGRGEWRSLFDRFELQKFAGEVSIIGLRRSLDGQSHWLRRLTWIILLLSGVGCTFYLLSDRVGRYLQEPKSINTQFISNNQLELPVITLCSMRQIGKSQLEAMDPYLPFNYTEFLSISYFNHFQYQTLPDVPLPLALADFVEYYRQTAASMIQEYCWFGPGDDYCQNLPAFISTKPTDYGQCVVINGDKNHPYKLSEVGSTQGVHMYLKINYSDIFEHFRVDDFMAQGFAIVIHAKDSPFNMLKQSMMLPFDKQVKIGLEKSVTTLLSSGGFRCSSNVKPDGAEYSKEACLDECLFEAMYAKCGCILPTLRSAGSMEQWVACQTAHQWSCNVGVKYAFENAARLQEKCNCPKPCTTITYSPLLTYAGLLPKDVARYNGSYITMLNVFYSSLNVRTTTQQWAYSFWSMLSDIGGALGLFVGSTLFTLLEIMEFILLLLLNNHYPKFGKDNIV